MCKNQTTLMSSKRDQWIRFGVAALIIIMFSMLIAASGVMPMAAGIVADTSQAKSVLGDVLNVVLDIVKMASVAVGIVVIIWGVFQIIMALRREDSEGIGKQITTIAVGGVLVGFGALIGPLFNTLIANM